MKKIFFMLTLCVGNLSNTKGWLSPEIYKGYFHKHIQNHAKRTSGYPFITGDTFRNMANHICDETNLEFDPKSVKYADIIFVGAEKDIIRYFLEKIHPRIANPYILITHNDDTSIPGPLEKYLDDPKLLTWFAQNIDRDHPKLVGIPIGFSNPVWGEIGNTQNYHAAMQNIPSWDARENKAYMNFNITTNSQIRSPIWNFFINKSFIHAVSRTSHRQHLEDLKKFRFVISPPGNGVDCVRHWESLLMGAIPIIKHSALDPLFQYLPVILIHEWSQVTPEFLEEQYKLLKDKTFNRDKLLIDYWLNLIRETQKEFRLCT